LLQKHARVKTPLFAGALYIYRVSDINDIPDVDGAADIYDGAD